MSIRKENFGKTEDGSKVTLYTMTNKNGMSVSVSDFGATVVKLFVPDRDGNLDDVVLGFPSVKGYLDTTDNFGGTIGRVCNRVNGAKTVIDGKEVILEDNDGNKTLHSGNKSYNKMFFEAAAYAEEDCESIEFSRLSPDGEQGWPGNLDVSVTYTLTDNNEFIIEYYAVSDKATAINLTNHSYFNLNGHASGDCLDHKIWINAKEFTPAGPNNVPEGLILPVKGTPMDFTEEREIGYYIRPFCEKKDFSDCDYEYIEKQHGYDHNYVLDTDIKDDEVELVATCVSEKTGRKLEVFTDLPGMHLYTGNWVEPKNPVKEDAKYDYWQGVCFETQHFPNACNVPTFPRSVYAAGEPFDSVTIFKFSVV
ncbi:MAG: galactose mutarotase [Lachnospiraceae bacterium]|nr:galactose mutarotase [Lachnospiraceae bacterium]